MINRDKVKRAFEQFVSLYDATNPKIILKVEHSYRVAENIDKLSGGDNTAWLIGLLHDVGRFEQLKLYDTFRDDKSVDHGQLGADMLFKDGLIRNFIEESEDDHLIENAIRFHNCYSLPPSLVGLQYAKLIQDADKIDIIRTCAESTPEVAYEEDTEEFLSSEITDSIYAEALSRRMVTYKNMTLPGDQLIAPIALVFSLHLPTSYRLVDEAGYIWKLFDTPMRHPSTKARVKNLSRIVKETIKEHENLNSN